MAVKTPQEFKMAKVRRVQLAAFAVLMIFSSSLFAQNYYDILNYKRANGEFEFYDTPEEICEIDGLALAQSSGAGHTHEFDPVDDRFETYCRVNYTNDSGVVFPITGFVINGFCRDITNETPNSSTRRATFQDQERSQCFCEAGYFYDEEVSWCTPAKQCKEGEVAGVVDGKWSCLPEPDPEPEPSKDCKDKKDHLAGNPCHVSSGSKYQVERDFVGDMPLTRTYDSQYLVDTGFGIGWRNNFQKKLLITNFGNSLTIVEGNGRGESWEKINGIWQGDIDSDYSIREVTNAFFVVTDQRENESRYLADGRLFRETTKQGDRNDYSYDSQNRLIEIKNIYGRTMSLSYSDDEKNHVVSATDDLGTTYRYEYDENDNLVAVIYPDTTLDESDNPKKIYHYENSDFPNHLTGITNANGDRYSTYSYNEEGKAISTEHAQTTNALGQKRIELIYQGSD